MWIAQLRQNGYDEVLSLIAARGDSNDAFLRRRRGYANRLDSHVYLDVGATSGKHWNDSPRRQMPYRERNQFVLTDWKGIERR